MATTPLLPLNAPNVFVSNRTSQESGSVETKIAKDPLAQSFFTYGVTGGCFVIAIDLYFQAKDSSIPLTVEIRKLVNGFPSPELVNPLATTTIDPAFIGISADASVGTRLKFPAPIYLEEDKEYCFVVLANTNNYSIWSSRLSEKSNETGVMVSEQPAVGSLFKSENNITWTPEQYEDIKFTLWKCKFDTSSSGSINLYTNPESELLFGEDIKTTSGSGVVRFKCKNQHGLEVGNSAYITCFQNSLHNGITATQLSGEVTITNVIDEYTFEYQTSGTATATGSVKSIGYVYEVYVNSGGSGYLTPPTITFSNGGGSGATATATVSNGKVTKITVTYTGSGYTSAPDVVITGSGSGATATAVVEARYSVRTNRVVNLFSPMLSIGTPSTSDVALQATTTTGRRLFGGTETPYQLNVEKQISRVGSYEESQTWLVSPENQTKYMGGADSFRLNIDLYSDNENVSPIIDFNRENKLVCKNNKINYQLGETISSLVTSSTGSIATLVVTNGGSGYTSPPTVNVITDSGTGVIATAVLGTGPTASQVVSITLTNGGSGFKTLPLITLTGGSGTGATVVATLTPFNTELLPSGGNAYAKYVTKKINLQTPSTGVRIFSTAYSEEDASFEFYIRTSLSGSGVDHSTLGWQLLKCDTDRNRSVRKGQYLEYKFYLDSIPTYNVFDIKIVLRSKNPSKPPFISDYRLITLV